MKLIRLGAVMFFALVVSSTVSFAQIYNASADFQISSNVSTNIWVYGWSTTLLSTLNLYTNGFVGGDGNQNWNDPSHISSGAPAVFNNPSNSTQGLVPAHTAAFHPGPSDEFSHFVWTSSLTGAVSISATFLPIDSGGTTVYILDNGVTIFSAPVFPGTGGTPSYSTTVAVTNGDKIDFAVDFGGDGNFFSDSTGLQATITVVPEPTTAALLMVTAGCGLVAGARRRFQQ